MTHLDPETLALLALGEDAATATERLHLVGCETCRAEVRRFARPVDASRDAAETLVPPAPHVWAGIAEALDLGAAVGDPSGPAGPSAADAGPSSSAAPRSRVRRSRSAVVAILAAAAAVLVIGGVGVGLLSVQRGVQHGVQRVATATLSPFPDWPGDSGTAVLERLPDGRDVVRVTTTVRPDGRTDHEVWLMTAGAKRLVSLGLLHGTSGTFTVPAGLDLRRFRLVDVSDEPRDGDPAHSGDSIIRGALGS